MSPVLSPEQLVEAQLAAYNGHDLERFLGYYAEEVVAYAFPDQVLFAGKAAMRERYARILFPGSTVHAAVPMRRVQGEHVIDHEDVTGHPLFGDAAVTVIYQASGGLIRRVWMLR